MVYRMDHNKLREKIKKRYMRAKYRQQIQSNPRRVEPNVLEQIIAFILVIGVAAISVGIMMLFIASLGIMLI